MSQTTRSVVVSDMANVREVAESQGLLVVTMRELVDRFASVDEGNRAGLEQELRAIVGMGNPSRGVGQ